MPRTHLHTGGLWTQDFFGPRLILGGDLNVAVENKYKRERENQQRSLVFTMSMSNSSILWLFFSIKMENIKVQVPKKTIILGHRMYYIQRMTDIWGNKKVGQGGSGCQAKPQTKLVLLPGSSLVWLDDNGDDDNEEEHRRLPGRLHVPLLMPEPFNQCPRVVTWQIQGAKKGVPKILCKLHDSAFLILMWCQQDWM